MVVRVGDRGQALTALRPQGAVRIDSNRHDAWCPDGFIESGSEIVVVGGSLQGLVVRKVEPGQAPRLPDQGKVVSSSFGEVVRRQGQREDAERQEWEAQLPYWRKRRRAHTIRRGAVLGPLIAAGGHAPSWGGLEQEGPALWLLPLAVAAVGLLWGIGVFWCLDGQFQQHLADELHRWSGKSYDRLVLVNAILVLLIAAGGACLGIATLGLGGGLAVAAVTTVILLLVLPSFVASFIEADE
jgi:hypothetical protein